MKIPTITKKCIVCNDIKSISDFYYQRCTCKKCLSNLRKQKRKENPEENKTISKNNSQKRKIKIGINQWRKERSLIMRNYRSKNNEKHRKYEQERYQKNTSYRITRLLRRRIYEAINKNIKSDNTLNLIGCSIEFLKEYLQKTAIQNGYLNFNVDNYSGKDYHIDHIIPCSLFDMSQEKDQQKCFHWSNLQILSAQDNLIKHDNY
jgi:hypothetical protein